MSVVVVPGYQIPPSCYSALAHTTEAEIIHVDDATTISGSAQALLARLSSSKKQEVVLLGHSRGGAVAVAAAAAPHTPVCGLILIDPVDDDATSTLLSSAALVACPVLILSTPYAGASSYYRKPYVSVCAPAGRNADTFFDRLKNRTASTTLVVLPKLGHLALLDDSAAQSLPTANLCGPAVNRARIGTNDEERALKARVLRLIAEFASSRGEQRDVEELGRQIDNDVLIYSS